MLAVMVMRMLMVREWRGLCSRSRWIAKQIEVKPNPFSAITLHCEAPINPPNSLPYRNHNNNYTTRITTKIPLCKSADIAVRDEMRT